MIEEQNGEKGTFPELGDGFATHHGQINMGKHFKNQNGFTLLELLVAIVLMAIGIFAVLGMQSVAMNSSSTAHELSVATSLGQQVLEDILSWNISDSRINTAPPPGGNAYVPDPTTGNTFITVPGAGTFTPTWTRTFPAAGGNGVPDGTVMIVVTITFGNNNRTVTLTGFKRMV